MPDERQAAAAATVAVGPAGAPLPLWVVPGAAGGWWVEALGQGQQQQQPGQVPAVAGPRWLRRQLPAAAEPAGPARLQLWGWPTQPASVGCAPSSPGRLRREPLPGWSLAAPQLQWRWAHAWGQQRPGPRWATLQRRSARALGCLQPCWVAGPHRWGLSLRGRRVPPLSAHMHGAVSGKRHWAGASSQPRGKSQSTKTHTTAAPGKLEICSHAAAPRAGTTSRAASDSSPPTVALSWQACKTRSQLL